MFLPQSFLVGLCLIYAYIYFRCFHVWISFSVCLAYGQGTCISLRGNSQYDGTNTHTRICSEQVCWWLVAHQARILCIKWG